MKRVVTVESLGKVQSNTRLETKYLEILIEGLKEEEIMTSFGLLEHVVMVSYEDLVHCIIGPIIMPRKVLEVIINNYDMTVKTQTTSRIEDGQFGTSVSTWTLVSN